MDQCGPGQALAGAITELKDLLGKRGCSITLR